VSHTDARARLEALLQRVVSRKDAPRVPRATATAAPRAAVEPALRPATRTAPLVAVEPQPEPARLAPEPARPAVEPDPIAPEDLFEPDPAGPEISEDGDESVEISTSSLDLPTSLDDDLYDLREPAPVAPVAEPAPLVFDPPTPVFIEEPAALPDIATPVAAPLTSPLAEPADTQRYDARPLPEPQRARVVAMPVAAPTPLRDLVRRSMELRLRRPHRP